MRAYSLIVVAAVVLAAGAQPARAELTADERAKLVRYLTETRDHVLAEAGALSEAQWTFRPGPDRWSVGEVVQHLALSEPFLFDVQQKLVSGPAATAEQRKAAQGQDQVVLTVIPDRTQKVNAPEPLQPAGKTGARTDVLTSFRTARGRTIDYAARTDDDVRGRIGDSPMGPLDGYQWLLFIGAHTERHLAQLREVKAAPDFPK
jgi:hypothetical protein